MSPLNLNTSIVLLPQVQDFLATWNTGTQLPHPLARNLQRVPDWPRRQAFCRGHLPFIVNLPTTLCKIVISVLAIDDAVLELWYAMSSHRFLSPAMKAAGRTTCVLGIDYAVFDLGCFRHSDLRPNLSPNFGPNFTRSWNLKEFRNELDVKSGTGPRLDIQLQVPTSPNLFGAAVLHSGTKTYQVES
ncbi:hypothetical protein B0H19DRAFT_1067686 [Mycena capillaripes]|nr:hypothetical protein B0H19DRAFT_1067686 [Mycena capillaripes]